MTDKWYTHTHTHTHTRKPGCAYEDMRVLWNYRVHTDGDVMVNRPDVKIKAKKTHACQ
jgi:hypothetical protein